MAIELTFMGDGHPHLRKYLIELSSELLGVGVGRKGEGIHGVMCGSKTVKFWM